MILGSICVREGSKGVPDKNIRPINGIPLMGYTIESAKNSNLIDDLIISTDSDEIIGIANDYGVNAPFRRPAELATDTANKWDVFNHLVDYYHQNTSEEVEVLVDLDVTVPLKTGDDIDGAIQALLDDPETDVVVTAYEADRNPYFNMVEIGDQGYASMVKNSAEPIVSRQQAPKVYSLTPAVFAIRINALRKYTHWSQSKFRIFPIPRMRAVDIDTETDFKFVEYLMQS